MNTSKQQFSFSQTLIALAVLAAFGPAVAQEAGDIAQLTAPGTSVSVGVGAATGDSKDRARFGMFNGLRDNKVNGLLGFSYLERDNEAGRWFTFEGRNLGLDNQDLGFSSRQLGDSKLTLDYSEITRHDPRTINTGLQGAGTTTPTVVLLSAPGTGQDLNLELKRRGVTLGGEKWLNNSLQLEVTYKNEDKDGARFFGRGFACSSGSLPSTAACPSAVANVTTGWALLMLPEPVHSTIRQLDAKLNYSGDNLKLTGGYYGSVYDNQNGNMTPSVPGTLNNPLGNPLPLTAGLQGILQLPMALPPDSQAHQLYLSGNYRFTPTTRATFKYAYTHATQNNDFANMGLTGAPAGRTNLEGVVNTTLTQVGLTARPMDKLSLLANVRYDEKKNKTPIDLYNTEGTSTFTNANPSPTKFNTKLEGSYQLPDNYRATLGADYEAVDHGTVTPTDSIGGVTGMRQKTVETGWRAELRRSMSETLTGAVSYVSSRREGNSSWLRPNTLPATGVTPVSDAAIYNRTAIFPFVFEDRKRDKVKLMANWSPADRVSLQFFVESGRDKYSGPTDHGLRDTGYRMYSADAAYALSDAWKLTGYLSRGDQVLHAGHSTGYDAALRDIADSLGINIVGKPSSRLQVGGDLAYLNDKLEYQQEYDPLASAANQLFLTQQGGLPDVTYRLLRLKLYGEYAIQKNAYVRLDLVHQRTLFNEWTYGYNGVPFTYSDNTTLSSNENQNVTFVGLSYIQKWQ